VLGDEPEALSALRHFTVRRMVMTVGSTLESSSAIVRRESWNRAPYGAAIDARGWAARPLRHSSSPGIPCMIRAAAPPAR
jgi:hypothetical protein